MAQMGGPGLTADQKAELWQRWRNGQSLSDIGRVLGKHAGSIHGVVSSKETQIYSVSNYPGRVT